MFSTPWSIFYGISCVVPVLILMLRAWDRKRPLVLPARAWTVAHLLAALSVLGAALTSPYRGPALQWSAPLLAGLALSLVVVDWLQFDPDPVVLASRRRQLLNVVGYFFLLTAGVSVTLWAQQIRGQSEADLFAARNPYPLGHSNYTAGLALLMAPVFGALWLQNNGFRRWLFLGGIFLALLMLFTSGSRGGLLGLGVLVVALLPTMARALRLRLWPIMIIATLVVGVLLIFNPRTRTLITPEGTGPDLRESSVQRAAMMKGGIALGFEHPFLGWGPGTTPLAFPQIRHRLDGGVENVLQLHTTPIQIWAEYGVVGLFVALMLVTLAGRAAWQDHAVRPIFLGLLGYGAFSLSDWQIDIPIFAATIAISLAALAPREDRDRPALRRTLGIIVVIGLIIVVLWGRADPTPALNLEALSLAREPVNAPAARALFEHSLAINPDQEIAHFNLGWLLITTDASTAARHFSAAAQLVPDKGGVYFGLGLAQLNHGDRPAAIRALAVECINDPLFLTSPWWRSPVLATLRPEVFILARELLTKLTFSDSDPRAAESRYLIMLTAWLEGTASHTRLIAVSSTPERIRFFNGQPNPASLETSEVRAYRRARLGYPVLMRDLDLPAPIDLFEVQENTVAATELHFLFPHKGWLPAPQLLSLMNTKDAHP